VEGFREYLGRLPADELPEELGSADLSTFHYGEWLLERGFDFVHNRGGTPLFFQYVAFQQENIRRYFTELADYAREYARSVGREILVSGNFFNLFEHYYPLEPSVDVVVTEMRNTLWRQPDWYRLAAGFARGKPLVVVENPYGGVVPELAEALKRGRWYDRFRQSIHEASALGVNMSVPYGAWMGSVAQDSFSAPHELAAEVQGFLADHEHLYAGDPTWAEVGVVYGVLSNARSRAAVELPSDNRVNEIVEGDVLAFDQVSRVLAASAQPYDVLFFPDGELRADTLSVDDLGRYRTLVVPGVDDLTERQAELLEGYLDSGGRMVVVGTLGTNLGERADGLRSHPSVTSAPPFRFGLGLLPHGPQVVVVEGRTDVAVNLQRTDAGAALHFVRYDYDEAGDRVPPLDLLVLDVRLPFDVTGTEAFSPEGDMVADARPSEGATVRVTLRSVPIAGIVLLRVR
jgi:hypothetical protein